jgi:tetraacyldisaccharide 4'-kinase
MVKPSAELLRRHRRIVRGETTGLGSRLARLLLALASLPYEAASRLRNAAFNRRWLKTYRAPLPVVSVGNITAGGVGKTPFVETLVKWLIELGWRPVIVSRGYGGRGSLNDEALLLKENLPTTPHLQNANRVAASQEVKEKDLGNVVVLDDGFQHRRLHRDLDIVLLDATDPFGGERILPGGFLREPVASLARADAVVLTRASSVSHEACDRVRRRVLKTAPKAAWAELDFHPTCWRKVGGERLPIGSLGAKRVIAFCGIGNPEAFLSSLGGLGLDVVEFHPFPDHHPYDTADTEFLSRRAKQLDAEALICTQKDQVKIPQAWLGETPLYSLHIQTNFRHGEEALRELVSRSVVFRPIGRIHLP